MRRLPGLSELSLEEKVGQMLAVGFPAGEEGFAALEGVVERVAAGNVILFARNVGEPAEVRALTDRVRALIAGRSGIPPLVSIDQEGGVVARIRRGVTMIPGAMAQAAAVASGRRSLDEVRALGRIVGTELLALGVDWDFAPDADVNVNPANPVIGVRSYGEDPERVAALAGAFARGLGDAGLLATAKHFPGHGDTAVDSHLGLPLVPHGRDRLEAVELLPFRRLVEAGVPAVMSAHVRFPAVEPEELPATLSPKVIQGLLRGELGFRGLVVTDCLEMKAIADHYPDAAVQAVEAGIDILLVSHTASVQEAYAKAILAALRSGRISESRIDESVARILAAKAALPEPPAWEPARAALAAPDSLALARGVMADAISQVRPGPGWPPAPGALYVDVEPEGLTGAEELAAAVPGFAASVAGGGGGRSAPAGSVAAELLARGSDLRPLSLSPDPRPAEIEAVLAALADPHAPGLVLGSHNARLRPGQLALAEALGAASAASGKPLALLSMRGPYDLPALEGAAGRPLASLCAFEYTPLSAAAVAEALALRLPAAGTCPVDPYPAPDGSSRKEVIS